jgi:hypothetical protein
MITDYLGPHVIRGGSTGATLNALRVRLEQNEVTDARREDLCWQVREAIRTEVFKVKLPAPPPPRLLALVAATEALLTAYAAPTRPFFFPGARVSVPAPAGAGSVAVAATAGSGVSAPRSGTTLQLRFREVEGGSVPEALVHLDGEDGGSFKWVQTSVLAPLADQKSLARSPSPTPSSLSPAPSPARTDCANSGGGTLRPMSATISASLVPTTPSPHIPTSTGAQIQLPRPHCPVTAPSAALPQTKQQKQHQLQHIPANDPQSVPTETPKKVSSKPLPNAQPPLQIQQKQPKQLQQSTQPARHQKPPQKQPQQVLQLPPRPQSLVQAQQLTVLPPRGPGRLRRDDPRAVKPTQQPGEPAVANDLLPPAFVPDALRATSPPPRKRIRTKINGPVSLCSGSVLSVAEVCGAQPSAPMLAGSTSPPVTSAGDMQPEVVSLGEQLSAHLSEPVASRQARGTSMRRGRMRSLNAMTAKVMLIDRLVARRENVSCGGVVEYCVKWTGIGWDGCSWESRDALLQDVPGLVLAFDTRHPEVPSKAIGQTREAPAAEAEGFFRRATQVEVPEQRESSRPPEKRPAIEEPIMVPSWFDSPFVELTFSGMTLHIRPDEWTLFTESSSIVRDLKKRRVRFRQEFPEEFRRLFPITKAELAAKERNDAKTVIEGNMKKRKHFGSYPILFPRALGTVIRNDLAPPVPRADIEQAPPSWEMYFTNLGLECTNWEREFPPDMPTASPAVCRAVQHAKIVMSADKHSKSRERTSRLIQEREDKEPGGIGGITASAEDYLTKVRLATSVRTVLPPQQTRTAFLDGNCVGPEHVISKQGHSDMQTITDGESDPVALQGEDAIPSHTGTETGEPELLRNRNALFRNALKLAGPRPCAPPRWYDPVWCCWRYVRLTDPSSVGSHSGSTPSSEYSIAGVRPGDMPTAAKCDVGKGAKEHADVTEMLHIDSPCKDSVPVPSEP